MAGTTNGRSPRSVALVGPYSSGKSTLLHLLGCLDKPTSGSLSIAGQNVAGLSDKALSAFRAKRLGFIFQSFNLIPVLRAWENVEYPLLSKKLSAAEVLEFPAFGTITVLIRSRICV